MYNGIRANREYEEVTNIMNDDKFKFIGSVTGLEDLNRLDVTSLIELNLVPFVWVDEINAFLYYINGAWNIDKTIVDWKEIYNDGAIALYENDGEVKMSMFKDFDEIEMDNKKYADLISALRKLNRFAVSFIVENARLGLDIEAEEIYEMDDSILSTLVELEDVQQVMDDLKYWEGIFEVDSEVEGDFEEAEAEEFEGDFEEVEFEEIEVEEDFEEAEAEEFEEEVEEVEVEEIEGDFFPEFEIDEEEMVTPLHEEFDEVEPVEEFDEMMPEDELNIDELQMVDEIVEQGIVDQIASQMHNGADCVVEIHDESMLEDEGEQLVDDLGIDFDDESVYDDNDFSYDDDFDNNHFDDDHFEVKENDEQPKLEERDEMRIISDVFGRGYIISCTRPQALVPSRFIKIDNVDDLEGELNVNNRLEMEDNLGDNIFAFNENDLMVVLKLRIAALMSVEDADGNSPFRDDENLKMVLTKLTEAQMWLDLWSKIN